MPASRRAFTLIELLIVIAIIGILIALTLPAVQAARAQALRLKCANNLKQIGLGLAQYVTRYGGFPPGYYDSWVPYVEVQRGPGWGWAARILPDLEQHSLYNQITFEVSVADPIHATARTTPLDVFLCPADDMPRTWTATKGVTWIYRRQIYSNFVPVCDVAGSNYVGVFGVGEPGIDGDGLFYLGSFVRPQEITDGLTYTMAVGERSVMLNAGRGHATWTAAVPNATLWSCAPDPFDPDSGTCRREDSSGMILGHTGEGRGPGDPRGDVNQFLSRHDRGCHFVFCDGHVRFIRGEIDYKTYKALSTRAGGEVISDEF